MRDLLEELPAGSSIPANNPFAVSVSLPTLSDVIRYEEGDPSFLENMETGYPRFFTHKYVKLYLQDVRECFLVPEDRLLIPVNSYNAVCQVEVLLGQPLNYISAGSWYCIVCAEHSPAADRIRHIVRNCGFLISSRALSVYLKEKGILQQDYIEDTAPYAESEQLVKEILAASYHTSTDNVLLTNSGMNAIYAGIQGLCKRAPDKHRIVRIGHCYIDTLELLERCVSSVYVHKDIHDLQALEVYFQQYAATIALVFIESVSNPLLQVADLPELYRLCRQYQIPLMVDATFSPGFIATVYDHADVIAESLTKFASGHGDILAGSLITVNPEVLTISDCTAYSEAPAIYDTARLALEIKNYRDRLEKIACNTRLLTSYFRQFSHIIDKIYVASDSEAYKSISKSGLEPGVISLVFNNDLQLYYDRLPLAKGPSLGTEFTLVMPYVYLAHYEDTKDETAYARLLLDGLNKNMIRISVGTEPIATIISAFESVFATHVPSIQRDL